jgi:hypothetical protein
MSTVGLADSALCSMAVPERPLETMKKARVVSLTA